MERGTTMQHRKLTATLAVLAATAGVSAVAGSAQAAVINDSIVQLTSDTEVHLYPGSVAWDYSNGVVTPTVTGTMLMYNERCFRVSVTTYDGNKQLDVKHGAKRCIKNDSDTRTQAIDVSGVPDARTDRVTVAVEEQNQNNDDWVVREESGKHWWDAELDPYLDTVRLLGDGIDLGGGTFDPSTGSPPSSAAVTWSIDDGKATAVVDETLYLDDMAGMCGRVELRYLDEAGNSVETVDGTAWCPTSNAEEDHRETLSAAPSPQIFQVEVAMQTSPANAAPKKRVWSDVIAPLTAGPQTKSIAKTG
jgi:hypothetical protein